MASDQVLKFLIPFVRWVATSGAKWGGGGGGVRGRCVFVLELALPLCKWSRVDSSWSGCGLLAYSACVTSESHIKTKLIDLNNFFLNAEIMWFVSYQPLSHPLWAVASALASDPSPTTLAGGEGSPHPRTLSRILLGVGCAGGTGRDTSLIGSPVWAAGVRCALARALIMASWGWFIALDVWFVRNFRVSNLKIRVWGSVLTVFLLSVAATSSSCPASSTSVLMKWYVTVTWIWWPYSMVPARALSDRYLWGVGAGAAQGHPSTPPPLLPSPWAATGPDLPPPPPLPSSRSWQSFPAFF